MLDQLQKLRALGAEHCQYSGLHERGLVHSSPTPGGVPIPSTPPNTLPLEIGMRWDCGGPAPHLDINNCWSDMISGQYITVVAGAQEPDPTQGVLWVTTREMGEPITITYPSPTKSGPLVIAAVEETQIHVKAENGDRFLFQLMTRSWEME